MDNESLFELLTAAWEQSGQSRVAEPEVTPPATPPAPTEMKQPEVFTDYGFEYEMASEWAYV